jgi:hypothetical protein
MIHFHHPRPRITTPARTASWPTVGIFSEVQKIKRVLHFRCKSTLTHLQSTKISKNPDQISSNFCDFLRFLWIFECKTALFRPQITPHFVAGDRSASACLTRRFSIFCGHPSLGDRHGGTMLQEERLRSADVRRPQRTARAAPEFRPFGYVRTWSLHFSRVPGQRFRGPRNVCAILKRPTLLSSCSISIAPHSLGSLFPAFQTASRSVKTES